MRKLVLITAAVVALAGAGLAVAHGFDSKSVKSVSATFTATSAQDVRTSTCTGSDGHVYATNKGTYTGTATSTDASLNGTLTIYAESLIDTTANIGTVTGKLQIGSGGDEDETHFEAVYSGGNVAGIAEGHTQTPHTSLLANLSAAYSATGGFTNGKLGGGASGGDAVETIAGGCQPTPTPKPDRIVVHGAVTAVSTGSITAAGVTCTIPLELQTKVAGLGLVVGSQVNMTCTVSGGTNTLARIESRGHESDRKGNKHETRRDGHVIVVRIHHR